jgi:tRNA (mo5U34)-methyltransferase
VREQTEPTPDQARAAIAAYERWYHRIELSPGIFTPGINDSQRVLELLELPADLHGKRVLDIGTRDGFFAFECERRGADVVAVDYVPAASTGFGIAAKLIGSNVRYVRENISKMDPERFGHFDVVLMLGLLYHLRDPLSALDTVRDLATDVLFLETHVCDDYFVLPDGSVVAARDVHPAVEETPIMQFCPGTSLNADPTNFWAPNTACVIGMLHEAVFEVEQTTRVGNRSIFRARVRHDDQALYVRDIARGTVYPEFG